MKRTALLIFLLIVAISTSLSGQASTISRGLLGYHYSEDRIRISRKEMHILMQDSPEANYYWTKANRQRNVAATLYGVSIATLLLSVTVDGFDDPYQTIIGASILILPCLLYTSPSPRDGLLSRMPSSA